jgi:hypothetical protein
VSETFCVDFWPLLGRKSTRLISVPWLWHVHGMGEFKERLVDAAAGQYYLLTRGEAREIGASEKFIKYQVGSGRWLRVHPGVYQVDRRPLDSRASQMAAVLACGPEARVSHRAALVLWRLDGISSAPVEVTMPFGNLAVPEGVIVHRSRRPTPMAEVAAIPVSGPEGRYSRAAASLANWLWERLSTRRYDGTSPTSIACG